MKLTQAVYLLSVVMLCTVPASASERFLTTSEIKALITGKLAKYSRGGRAWYYPDGRYKYKQYKSWEGTYRVTNGQVCLSLTTGHKRCDRYLLKGKKYYFVDRKGRRFRARFSDL